MTGDIFETCWLLDTTYKNTIDVNRIILRPLSALFGLQFMLTMKKSVTFIGACANEIIPNG